MRDMASFDYVGTGEVAYRAKEPSGTDELGTPTTRLILLTKTLYKGERRSWLIIDTPAYGAACGLSSESKQTINFVASKSSDGSLYADTCMTYCAEGLGWFEADGRLGWIDGQRTPTSAGQ